ncbi:hypothetical protein D3C75_862550 [compost metagenome]
MKTVPFILLQHVRHINAAGFQGSNDLVGFCLLHPGIIGSLGHKQRRFNLVHMEQRRNRLQQLLILHRIAHPLVEQLPLRFPIRRQGTHQRKQVGRADIADAGSINLRGEGQACQSGISAIGCAVDGYPVRVGNALLHQPLYTVG